MTRRILVLMSHCALKELQRVPGGGPSIARDLLDLGLTRVADLRSRDPEKLYAGISRRAHRHPRHLSRPPLRAHREHDPYPVRPGELCGQGCLAVEKRGLRLGHFYGGPGAPAALAAGGVRVSRVPSSAGWRDPL